MTKQEVCRKLAEALEPVNQEIIAFPMQVVSPLGFWRGYGCVTGWKWGPVDFFTDAGAQWRLLEAMKQEGIVIRHLPSPLDLWCVYRWGGHNSEGISLTNVFVGDASCHPDRATSIVLAALRWKGIEGEIE